ncbi:MAG: ABC transporter permease, partial [Opitutus sp.]|nr:ABC transporter permease [Opitutus sp.]
MKILSLVLTNLRRHHWRALIGTAGIAFGVAAMLTILAIVTGAIGMFQKILSSDSHYLVFERNVSDLFFSSVTPEQLAAIRARPEVESAHPVLFGIVSAPGHPVVTCFGIEPSDPRLTKADWRAGAPADFGKRPYEIFLGSRAAEFLQARAGEEVEIGRGKFRVGGIFKTENGFEDGGVFLPLAAAQEFFHRGGAASVAMVKLRDQTQGAVFKGGIEAAEPGVIALENREFNSSYNSFKILNFTAWAVGICAFCLGGLGVANTMLLSVFTRIREIAVLRVCGFSAGQVAG